MKKNIYLVFLFLGLSTACSQKYNIHDPLPTYWQVKYNEKNYNDVNKQLQDKLNQIDEQVQKLKQEDWSTNVHGIYANIRIYANIQTVRNQKIVPMQTFEVDDL
jgi:hypothetical protein